MKLKVKVLNTQWAWGDGDESHVLRAGTHEWPGDGPTLTKDFARAIAAVAAADPAVLEIVSSDEEFKSAVKDAVESDHDSLKAQAAAQKDGSWHASNLEAYIAQTSDVLTAAEERGDEETANAARVRLETAKSDLEALGGEA